MAVVIRDIHKVTIKFNSFEFKYDRSFWDQIHALQNELRCAFLPVERSDKPKILSLNQKEFEQDGFKKKEELLSKIHQMIKQNEDELLLNEKDDKKKNSNTFVKIKRRDWENTDYGINTGVAMNKVPKKYTKTQIAKQQRYVYLLKKIADLLERDGLMTKRDIYYQNVQMFSNSQKILDEYVDDIACSLGVTRNHLHIVASSKGLVFGHLEFYNEKRIRIDCLNSASGTIIPGDVDKISYVQSNAKFVLIIEKDATFQLLIDLKIHEKFPLILVTGRGYPDANTRSFVNALWHSLNIPILVLVDCDPHGIEILSVYRHGSLSLSYNSSNLVVPQIRWFGLLVSDILDFNLKDSLIPLNDSDKKKIKDLYSRPYIKQNSDWAKQLQSLESMGFKAEIQSLAQHSPTFLLETYIPIKLRLGGWI